MSRILFFLFLLLPDVLCAQLVYPVVGQYKNKSAQGMAIYKDLAYLFSDGGLCRVLNLKTGKVKGEFMLASAGKTNHANSACFSRQFLSGHTVPAIYVTEFTGKSRCLVEIIDNDSSVLVQTIELKNAKGKNPLVRAWIVDNKEKMLYALIREKNQQETNEIKKFALPRLSDGKEIMLTEKDVLDSFTVSFVNGLQGTKIKGRYMYIATGFTPLHGEGPYFDRAIKVVDLKRKQLVKSIDLTGITMNEPEDIDFYKGNCLLFAGGTGGIYKAF